MPSNVIEGKHRNGNALDGYEEKMKELYIQKDYPLHRVKAMIDREARQNIPISQYRSKIRKLGWHKYGKTSETDILSIILAKRSEENKESEVFLWGELQPPDKVKERISRTRPSILMKLSTHQLPKGYHVRSPRPNLIEDHIVDMPFFAFEEALHSLSQDPKYQYVPTRPGISPQLLENQRNTLVSHAECIAGEGWNPISLSLDGTHSFGSSFFTNSPRALAALNSVLPSLGSHHHEFGSSPASYGARMANQFLRRQLLFSIANGFAGLGGFPISQPLKVLQGVSIDVIYQLLRLTQGPAARSIAQNLFKASIEDGNYTLVAAILSIEAAGIDVNKEKLFVEGYFYTPVERASMLRYYETIKVLLCHGADVDKTYSKKYSFDHLNGALNCAIRAHSYTDDRLDRETFQLLSNAAHVIHWGTTTFLIENLDEEHLLHLLKEHFRKCVWRAWDCRVYILDALSEESALDVMGALVRLDLQPGLFNQAAERGYERLFEKLRSDYDLCPDEDTLRCAITGGNVRLVQTLLSAGASDYDLCPDEDMLCCAIEGGNVRLVQMLLSARASDYWGGNAFRRTPLSVAIEGRNKELIDLMRREGAFGHLQFGNSFKFALEAAVDVGNQEILRELMLVRVDIPIDTLGLALWSASRTGNYQFAKELLDHGARSEENCLVEAIRQRNISLIELFLDSGHDSCGSNDNEENLPLALAAEWGDYKVVDRLITEGAPPSKHALYAALRRRDKKLADILLDAGADVNAKNGRDGGALWVAADMGDDDLARYVLDKGADPYDPLALEMAFRTNRTLFETILTAYKSRYNYRRKGFGSTVLKSALESRDTALIEYLLDHGADPHSFGLGVSPFGHSLAIDNSKNLAIVTQFLKAGCRPDNVVSSTSIWMEHDPRRTLCAPEDFKLPPRTTAFLAAISTENSDLVQLLFKNDERIVHAPARGSIKRTALQRAAEIGSFSMAKLIHNLGADVNEPPNRSSGATALQLAAIGGFGQIVCYLISHGAHVNAPGALVNGMTALVGAAFWGRLDIVSILLKAGAAREEDSCQFEKAIEMAEHCGHYATRDYLREQWGAQHREDSPEALDLFREFLNEDSCDD
ncbi:ankyrin, partial [Xylariaceae sp. AK1471]